MKLQELKPNLNLPRQLQGEETKVNQILDRRETIKTDNEKLKQSLKETREQCEKTLKTGQDSGC